MGARELISIDEARERVLAEVRPLPSRGRRVARRAWPCARRRPRWRTEDLPPFDASAMDGFAVPDGEPGTLRIDGESRAGAPSPSPLAAGNRLPDLDRRRRPGGHVRRRAGRGDGGTRRRGRPSRTRPTARTSAAPVRTCARARRSSPRAPSSDRRSSQCSHRSAPPGSSVQRGRGSRSWRRATSSSSRARRSRPARSETRTPTR